MAIKPILDVSHRGRRIRVQLAGWQKGVSMRYDILLDETPIQVDLFAEEVMRWLADALHEQFPAPTAGDQDFPVRKRRSLRR